MKINKSCQDKEKEIENRGIGTTFKEFNNSDD